MSYSPATLRLLAAYWVKQGGVNLGIVGNTAHRQGYHLGRDRVFSAGGRGWGDYSVAYHRDKAGLSNAASAIDLGRLNGSLTELRKFSVWLVERCMSHAPGTQDIREIIYSPDGRRVFGYSALSGSGSQPILGYGDASHLTHTHISFFRDSENLDKVGLFSPYFASAPASKPGARPVAKPVAKPTKPGKLYTVKAGDTLWRIAIRNLTTLGRIRALNPGIKDLIRPGQVIRVK